MRLFIDMQKFFDNWRDFIQEKEPKKDQKLLNEAATETALIPPDY